jgi:hypothetical protein
MENDKDKERAIIEFTCIPTISIETAQKLYEVGFRHLRDFLTFTLDDAAKKKGLVDILNYKILSQYIIVDEGDIPQGKFKCPMCMGMVFADEEECSECGALLLEEVLEVEMEDVYNGLREMIDTVLISPESAKNFLSKLEEGVVEEGVEEMDLIAREMGGEVPMQGGFSITSIAPSESIHNYLIIMLPHNEHEEEKNRIIQDLQDMGAESVSDFPIEGGNIANKQEDSVKKAVSWLLSRDDSQSASWENTIILNLKTARFMEPSPTIIVEDNRPFLSTFDDVDSDDPQIEAIQKILYDADLIKDIRRIGEKAILDSVSFNNDPLSFQAARECISYIRENPIHSINLVDVVLNMGSVDAGSHKDIVGLLKNWK